jgi:hypothetical protein
MQKTTKKKREKYQLKTPQYPYQEKRSLIFILKVLTPLTHKERVGKSKRKIERQHDNDARIQNTIKI